MMDYKNSPLGLIIQKPKGVSLDISIMCAEHMYTLVVDHGTLYELGNWIANSGKPTTICFEGKLDDSESDEMHFVRRSFIVGISAGHDMSEIIELGEYSI